MSIAKAAMPIGRRPRRSGGADTAAAPELSGEILAKHIRRSQGAGFLLARMT